MDAADKISNLAEDLLHCILSFLTTKQAVQTSILSRRWRYMFKDVQTLDLDLSDHFKVRAEGLNKYKTLDFCRQAPLVTFRVSRASKAIYDEYIKIGITFLDYSYLHGLYYVVFAGYRVDDGSHGLTQLNGVRFDNLRSFHLSEICILHPLENFISKCLVLEELKLERCRCCVSSSILSDKLKRLSLYRCSFIDGKILVSAPNLQYLNFDNSHTDVTLANLSSLVRASLNLDHKHEIKNVNALRNVQVLVLDCFHLEVLYEDCSSKPLATFNNLRNLTINCCLPSIKLNAQEITSLLHRSPVLETLVINQSSNTLTSCKKKKRKREHSKRKMMSFTCSDHLRVVEFRNFHSSPAEIELLRILSKNMKAKERITILSARQDY